MSQNDDKQGAIDDDRQNPSNGFHKTEKIEQRKGECVSVDENATTEISTTALTVGAAISIFFISIFACPRELHPVGKPTVRHVFYYGWISAVSTGLGVLPLVFVPTIEKFWIGVSNAVAAGMMTAASYSLIKEGCTFDEPEDTSDYSSIQRTCFGVILGILFILRTKSFLDTHEDLKLGGLGGVHARKVLLIIFVMTLHSFSEGVGIGVSFGGEHGNELGIFISASLAVHNVPEGLAVAIALMPRQIFSKLAIALWCIMTSLPQPLMAVPAFLFVDYFIPILPVGLGFAGGAMAYVAFFELLVEAYEDSNMLTTATTSVLSVCVMFFLQSLLDHSS